MAELRSRQTMSLLGGFGEMLREQFARTLQSLLGERNRLGFFQGIGDHSFLVAVAEIVSALALTFSLIALIISIRQNTKSQKALVVDSLAAAIASINVPAMESHTLGSAISKSTTNWGSPSREERIMTHYFLFFFLQIVGECFKAQWLGWETLLRKYYHSDGVCRV